MAERSEESHEQPRQTRAQQREAEAQEQAKQEEAHRVADAPNPTGPPGEGTVNPELLTSAEITKAHYARLPEEMKATLDQHAMHGQQFVRHGTRYEVGIPDGYVLASPVEHAYPKPVYLVPAPDTHELMEG